MAMFEEQKCLYYQSVYQQGCSKDHASGRCQKEYKPINVSQIFAPHYHPMPKKTSPSSSGERHILGIHAPNFDPQINETPQTPTSKRCQYQCGVELVNGHSVAFA